MNTCVVDGKSYRVGERIYPENSCYKCLCAPGFDNSISYADNSNCMKIDCGMENVLIIESIRESKAKTHE